jgi:hypothetical protein
MDMLCLKVAMGNIMCDLMTVLEEFVLPMHGNWLITTIFLSKGAGFVSISLVKMIVLFENSLVYCHVNCLILRMLSKLLLLVVALTLLLLSVRKMPLVPLRH